MLSEPLKARTRFLLEALARFLARVRITPNALTLTSFFVACGAAAAIAVGRLWLGGLLLLVAGGLDALDGAVARVGGRQTRFGGFLDSTLDRFGEAAIYLGLLYFYVYRQPEAGRLGVFLIYCTIVGSLMVSYARARAEGLGLECKVGLFTRLERVVLLAIGLFLRRVTIVLWMLAVMTNLTAVHRILHIWRATNWGKE